MLHRPPVSTRPPAHKGAAAVLALLLAASASYTVKPGDTLSGIAVKHGTSTRALADANNITNRDHIVAGRTLRLPATAAASASSGTGGTTHLVQSGETLSQIAVTYRVRSSAISAANGISDPNRIIAGRRLTIPGVTAASGASAGTVRSASAPAAAASRAEVGALIERTAREYGWNPSFVKALAWQESGWNNRVVSSAGAVGVMQVLPSTGQWINTYLSGGRTLDLNDPADNVRAGILFLDYLHRITGGDMDMILAGYYQGLASVNQHGVYPSTRQYIANVRALRDRF